MAARSMLRLCPAPTVAGKMCGNIVHGGAMRKMAMQELRPSLRARGGAASNFWQGGNACRGICGTVLSGPSSTPRQDWQREAPASSPIFSALQTQCRGLATRPQARLENPPGVRMVKKNIKGSVWKLNLLARQIQGKNVEDAQLQMKFSDKRRSEVVSKAITTACNMAEIFHDLEPDELYIEQAMVGRGSYSKRPYYRARGRVDFKRKTTSQLILILREGKGKGRRKQGNRKRGEETAKSDVPN
eukprot:g975.t1